MTEVRVRDWRDSVRWYRDVLGLRVVLEDGPGQFALLEVRAGGGRVALKGGADEDRGGRGTVRLVFEVDDVDEWLINLGALGVAVEGPSTSTEGYREIRVGDPDGTPIGLFSWVGVGSQPRG